MIIVKANTDIMRFGAGYHFSDKVLVTCEAEKTFNSPRSSGPDSVLPTEKLYILVELLQIPELWLWIWVKFYILQVDIASTSSNSWL